MKRALLLSFFVLASGLVASCGDDPVTEILLSVDAEDAVKASTTQVVVELFDPNGTSLARETATAPVWPLKYALVKDSQSEFVAVVTATGAANAVVATAVARATFSGGRTKLYAIRLTPIAAACAGASCPFATECVADGGSPSCVAVTTTAGGALPDLPRNPEAPGALDPCTSTTCEVGEGCVLRGGVPTCECLTGYAPSPSGLGCYDVCSAAGAPSCGTHGRCVAQDGAPVCACDFPWTGSACDQCGTGWVLNAGTCVGACRGTCGVHEICDETIAVPACRCAIGYANPGSGCTWQDGAGGGGIIDGELTDASKWTAVQTNFDPTYYGPTNGGATMRNVGICGTASLGQRIQMPSYSDAEPLQLEVTVTSNDGSFMGDTLVQARMGSSLLPLTFTGGTTKVGVACLGANAFGPDIDFALVPDANYNPGSCIQGMSSSVAPPVTIDRIRLVPVSASTCPTSGVTNGAFNSTAGWTTSVYNNGQPGSATIAGGVATLSLTKYCQNASVRQTLTFPTAAELPTPALRFSVNGTSGEALRVSVTGGVVTPVIASPIGSGASAIATVCIPPYLQGTNRTLRFALEDASGTCATDYVRSFVIDDVTFVSDPSCAGVTSTFDGTFERGPASTSMEVPTYSSYSTHPALGNVTNLALAHSGSGVFQANDLGAVTTMTATAWLQVPTDPTGATRPQIRYWYRTSTAATSPSVSINGGTPVAGTTTWTERVRCVDPVLSGQVIPFTFQFTRTSAGATVHYLDDVTITLGSGC